MAGWDAYLKVAYVLRILYDKYRVFRPPHAHLQGGHGTPALIKTTDSDGLLDYDMSPIQKLFNKIQTWLRCRAFREGKTVSRFIATDIRSDILVISAARVDDGIITGRVRTTNVLYLSKGLVPQPEFEPARELRIEELWQWTGQNWGG